MNQPQRLIDSIRDAPHDAVIVAGMFAIPALIALWIVNRMRHPERGLLHALVIASVGFVLVPCVSSAVLILWVRTGGDSIQAAFVSMFVFVFGFWGFRRWLRSAPRAAKPAKALVAQAVSPLTGTPTPSAVTAKAEARLARNVRASALFEGRSTFSSNTSATALPAAPTVALTSAGPSVSIRGPIMSIASDLPSGFSTQLLPSW